MRSSPSCARSSTGPAWPFRPRPRPRADAGALRRRSDPVRAARRAEVPVPDRLTFVCNGRNVEVEVEAGESLLSVLREQLGLDVGEGRLRAARAMRLLHRPRRRRRARLVRDRSRACRGSQRHHDRRTRSRGARSLRGRVRRLRRIAVRLLHARDHHARGRDAAACARQGTRRAPLPVHRMAERVRSDRAWCQRSRAPACDLAAAAARAALEGGVAQRVDAEVPLGGGGFADDSAPRAALVAVPLPPGSDAEFVEAAGLRWVIGESLEARTAAGKVQGRRTTVDVVPPLPLLPIPEGGVRLATSWVEPTYLEPDTSWCEPGGTPASPLANGGAFGGKEHSRAPEAARESAARLGRTARVVYARRRCPARPEATAISATAVWRDGCVTIEGSALRVAPFAMPNVVRDHGRHTLGRCRRARAARRLRAARVRTRCGTSRARRRRAPRGQCRSRVADR